MLGAWDPAAQAAAQGSEGSPWQSAKHGQGQACVKDHLGNLQNSASLSCALECEPEDAAAAKAKGYVELMQSLTSIPHAITEHWLQLISSWEHDPNQIESNRIKSLMLIVGCWNVWCCRSGAPMLICVLLPSPTGTAGTCIVTSRLQGWDKISH